MAVTDPRAGAGAEDRPTMRGTRRTRTAVVALLVAVVGVRVSLGRGLDDVAGRVSSDPAGPLAHTLDGWTTAGTLGEASAADLRALPLSLLHRLGELAGVSAGTTQAMWTALVLVVAVVGARRLASAAARPGDDSWAPWVAALIYACGPVLVATAARAPLDGLVAAVLPWVLLPLVRRDRGVAGAARSAAWLGLVGVGSPHWSVSALAAGLLAAVLVWRGQPGQLVRWLVLAALSSAWWCVVLVWEARRATVVTELFAHSGVRDLLGDAVGRPDWSLFWLVVIALGPLAVAVAALVLRPERLERGVVGALVVVALVVGLAQASGAWLPPVLAPSVLNGNAGTFGPVLAWWGLAALLAWGPVTEDVRSRLDGLVLPPAGGRQLVPGVVASAVALSCLAGVAVAVQEPATASTSDSPDLWQNVAAWSEQAPPGRVLVLPATAGRLDPVVRQALAGRAWVGRDSRPTSGAPATAALDDTVRRLALGQSGPEVLDGLRRLGFSYVLLRDDEAVPVDRRRSSALVRAALRSGGATRLVVHRGERSATGPKGLVDFGVRSGTPEVEIWSVGGASGAREVAGEPLEVVGDPASTADLVASGVLGPRAVRLREEAEKAVVSDSARRRDVDQREAIAPYGPLLEAHRSRVVVPTGAAPRLTAVRRLSGVRSVTASSSSSDLGVVGGQPGADAVAGADGNVYTSWRSVPGTSRGQWWQLSFTDPVPIVGTVVQVVQNVYGGQLVTEVEVRTNKGRRTVEVPVNGRFTLTQAETTSRLRITATAVTGGKPTDSFGIAEVTVPGVVVRDDLVFTRPAGSGWVMATRPGSPTRCVPAAPLVGVPATATVCDPAVAVAGTDTGSMNRVLSVRERTTVAGRAWARPADTRQVATLADQLGRPSVSATATSVAAQDLVTRPQAAADDNETTSWRASPEDAEPALTLKWETPALVRGLALRLPDDGVTSVPQRVRVQFAPGEGTKPRSVERALVASGLVTLPPVRTRSLTVTFLEAEGPKSTDVSSGRVRPSPVAVSEVQVVGGPDTAFDLDRARTLPCGRGPTVTVAGEDTPTRVRLSARDLIESRPVTAPLCSRPVLAEGENPVTLQASFSWFPLGLVLAPPGGKLGDVDEPELLGEDDVVTPLDVDLDALAGRWGAAVDVDLRGSGTRTVVLASPAGRGWTARADGARLRSVTVDGWAQGWVVPAGVERVSLTYSAGASLRLGAGVGVLGWLLVLGIAVARPLLTRRRDQARVGRSTQA